MYSFINLKIYKYVNLQIRFINEKTIGRQIQIWILIMPIIYIRFYLQFKQNVNY